MLTVYVYHDNQWAETLDLINTTSPYGLTGAVFARDRSAREVEGEREREREREEKD